MFLVLAIVIVVVIVIVFKLCLSTLGARKKRQRRWQRRSKPEQIESYAESKKKLQRDKEQD